MGYCFLTQGGETRRGNTWATTSREVSDQPSNGHRPTNVRTGVVKRRVNRLATEGNAEAIGPAS